MEPVEANLSVLAGSGVGFEPPAPPTADDNGGKDGQHQDDGVNAAAEEGAGEIGPRGGNDVNRNDGDASTVYVDSDRGKRAGLNEQQHAPRHDNGTADRVLHGVSAAIASRALAPQQETADQDERIAINGEPRGETCFGGDTHGEAQSQHQRREGDKGGRQSSKEAEQRETRENLSQASAEWDLGTNDGEAGWASREGGTSGDDKRQLAQRQIDQALRERALKRRHRFGGVAGSIECRYNSTVA